ncbi:TPA: hypothetical protein ACGU7E_004663 [Vibrio vulnificus]|uniref:hypothetical protein n=1 Tax=Vibrio vulnificus TaxID=672 RepID=UPI00092A6CC0|nr:hypothetical protein [Vibrio vulnificus]OJI53896.1 hypothetical protein VV1062A_02934 [Vibrio vulnificus]OJI53947.1 hypothetical protein VFL11327_04365 [Vibrio fluvialis]POB28455.1 hypothetical protein CRN47_01840 [Vibrio vulnificus]HDY8187754.1 hypothetical protein [Vibrio vulnificus]
MRNPTLFGLKTNCAIRILYNVEQEKVIDIVGLEVNDPDEIEISELKGFNLPQFISISGIPYYPSKYEFSSGDIWYHAKSPPFFSIKLQDNGGIETSKTMKARITPAMIKEFNKSAKVRPRRPDQKQVMGESAAQHVKKLIDGGYLIVPKEAVVQWQWCHLVAFSMLPAKRAQAKKNMIAGTAACNGHMANIEAAVKMFIQETGRAVSLEVTSTVVYGSQLGRRIRYQVVEPKSGLLFREYFDALTDVKTDYADFGKMYDKLMAKYNRT